MQPASEDLVARARAACLALPKVVEQQRVAEGLGRLSGTIACNFTVSRRVVARVFVLQPGVGASDDEQVLLWLRADPEEREALAQSGHPYFRAGPRELGIVLDDATDWTEVAELVSESYRLVAPRHLQSP